MTCDPSRRWQEICDNIAGLPVFCESCLVSQTRCYSDECCNSRFLTRNWLFIAVPHQNSQSAGATLYGVDLSVRGWGSVFREKLKISRSMLKTIFEFCCCRFYGEESHPVRVITGLGVVFLLLLSGDMEYSHYKDVYYRQTAFLGKAGFSSLVGRLRFAWNLPEDHLCCWSRDVKRLVCGTGIGKWQ